MADEPTNSSEREETEPTNTEEPANKPDSETREIPAEVKRALSKANKEAETLRRKLKEYEDSQKTETEKLAEQKAEAERAAAETNLKYLRLKVGTEKGLPPGVAERLQGATEDEMVEDADRLLELIKPGSPSGSADGGNRGKSPEAGDDMNSLLRKAALGS